MKKAIVLVAVLAMVSMVGGMAYADLNTDLVSYWNFDQGPGTVVLDQSVNGNDGTIKGDPTWVDGVCGNALDFDGVDDYVELPDIDLVPNPFTICAWVSIQDNTLQGSYYIFGRTHGNVAGEYNFAFKRLAENDTNYCLYFDAIRDPAGTTRNAYEAAWTNEPSPMGWHFYCASWDGVARCPDGPGTFGGPYEGVKLYIDGVLQTNITPWGSCDLHPRSGTHLTAIGAYEGREPPTPAPRSGFAIDPIDEVRIYDRELSAEEIQDLYAEGFSCLVPPVTQLNCLGFESPLDKGPVTVKKNRALPHKSQLQDEEGYAVTDADIAAAPVIQVLYESTPGANPEDVTDEALSAGMGTDGNQCVWTEDGKWQFNLKTSNYTAPGTYTVTMQSGDNSEYVIDPTCESQFVIK
jgi:hypothetical protein